MPTFISKSKYLSGLQCSKLLWHNYHAKDVFPAVDAGQQAIFDQGHEVGEWAKRLFPGGIEVAEGNLNLLETVEETARLLERRVPLYEAAFIHGDAYARSDILVPVEDGQWDLHEVKSGTTVKDVNRDDVAFQLRVLTGAGLRVRKCYLTHINNQYVRSGAIDPQQLLHSEDVTEEAHGRLPSVAARLAEQSVVIEAAESPEVPIGPHCSNPYDCPLKSRCWDHLPEHNVFHLYRGGKKSWRMFEDGISALVDAPEDSLNVKQAIQLEAVRTEEPRINADGIRRFLDTLEYPLFYLDFETFSTAVPLFDDVRPYRQIPFQFSLHIQDLPGGELIHHGYLAASRDDPRVEFMQQLRDVLGSRGSVVVYNAPFEVGRLRETAQFLPAYQPWVEAVEARIVDLLKPFRAFDYYHPDQHGSASIKAVLPALVGRSYDDLDIKEGGTASMEFMRVTFGDVEPADRERVRRALEIYCGMDTEAMVWIVEKLRALV